jgi:uncharacterized membrane protein
MSLFSKKPLLNAEVQNQVVERIKAAELKTTAEVRVYVEAHCEYMDPLDRAKEIFVNLGMDKTEKRNAVIIYLAIKDKQFALFGDTAIYELAGGPKFWESAAQHLVGLLREGKIGEGLCACIDELSNAMANHFPYDPTITKNELPDEIVFGK